MKKENGKVELRTLKRKKIAISSTMKMEYGVCL